MIQKLLLCLLMVLLGDSVKAQQVKSAQTGHFTGIYTQALFLSTTKSDLEKTQLHYSFESLYKKSKSKILHTGTIKQAKMLDKLNNLEQTESIKSYKVAPSNPLIQASFKGNELKSWTPTDNAIAISNGGILVSCVNYGIEYYDMHGNALLSNFTWNDFINNAVLDQGKFDPRVIYDNKNDRFIVVLLHGFSSSTSKILVCFSKSNNPLNGWNIYQMSGCPFGDTSWSDYPNIGLNDDELFIGLNRFGDAPDYNWKKTYLYQIGLIEGYNGQTLQYGLWDEIYTPDSNDGITLVSASEGMGRSLKDKMYFVQLMPDSGSYVYLYTLTGNLAAANPSLTVAQYPVPHFEVCANALQKNPTDGTLDSLSSGSAWAQNAFIVNGIVHYTHSADIGQGWCGVSYGRIDMALGKAEVNLHGEIGTDLAYPAVAFYGDDSSNQEAMIAYLQSDASMTPQCGVIGIDNHMNWSARKTVKTGDTVVNILYPPDYAIQPERWGDYTGICRKFNSPYPDVWIGAAYGANTPPRKASYGTWIAEIGKYATAAISNDLIIYPNPMSDMFTIEFENQEAGNVVVQMLDASGRVVQNLFNDYLKVSKNRISFNKLALANGVYLIKVSRNGKQIHAEQLIVYHG